MITWGISANGHDASLAVFDNRQLKFASHAERFSGKKNDAHLNAALISYARQWGEPDEVVWYERPLVKTVRQFKAGQGWNYKENNIKQYLKSYGITAPIKYSSHHHSHAAAGYYTSPFSEATVICIDSIGEFETLTIWKGEENKLKKVYSQGYPHSIGLWYSAMTQRIGLKPNEDEYILMGMAAYGDPERLFMDIFNDFIDKTGMGYSPSIKIKHNLHRGCKWWRPDLTTEQDMFDIAAATQKVYEYILVNTVLWASRKLPSRNLVFMGGCALNCLANRLLSNYYDNTWIMPNPGDAGSAIGSVLADKQFKINFSTPYLGYNIDRPYPVQAIVAELENTGMVGVANGAAEFGPRALGNRSLLADPRGTDMQDRVNAIKKRQKFRPFAPVILEEEAPNYFAVDQSFSSPFMQNVVECKYPEQFPAITHADGTSRVQTVNKNQHPKLYGTIKLWQQKTGCPMLLNTSLNIKGKPIVNDLHDAEDFEKFYGVKVL